MTRPTVRKALSSLRPRFTAIPLVDSLGQAVVHVPRADYVALIKSLLADGYGMVIDLCAIDFLKHPGRSLPQGCSPERFEVVVNLLDLEHRRRLRVRVQVPQTDPTLSFACSTFIPARRRWNARPMTCSGSNSPTTPTSHAS